jgi:hypothetical protein
MKLVVNRLSDNKVSTIGALYIDGVFQCFTLEDEKRLTKVMGETRIPDGVYDVVFRKEGTHHAKYGARYGEAHYGMLHIINVPNFKWILIHIGNTEKDTDGCLLVGEIAYASHTIGSSTVAYEKLYKKVADALLKGDKVTIEFRDVQPYN